jgi:hypothetical protein
MPAANLPANISAYLNRRGASGPWQTHALPTGKFSGAIVIPSLAEAANLPRTLASLAANPTNMLDSFLILIIVNQRADASPEQTADNFETVKMLPLWQQQYGLKNLLWVDAASPERALPPKQGVGLARKIGLDLALNHLDYHHGDPLLICLDADTLVQPDYLPAITRHFSHTAAGGVSIPYRHRPAADPAGQSAIDRYELFLRIYVLGLELAGSPYAFHTVGSAMACRASAYVASGGMNQRLAGEDFYFLQQLHKTSKVAPLTGTVVHPSPRSSDRVPFGTGRAVGDMLAEGEQRLLFYQPEVFSIVAEWLTTVSANLDSDGQVLMNGAALIAPLLHDFLQQAGFAAAWENMKRNNRTGTKLLTAFHSWFDAFRTMRLIHELSNHAYPRIEPEYAVATLLEKAGNANPGTISQQLDLMRRLQSA